MIKINPKQTNEERKISELIIRDFASSSKLTSKEFLIALDMSFRGELIGVNGKLITVYREISLLTLCEVEYGYLQHRKESAVFDRDAKRINEVLNPPKRIEMSLEDRKKMKKEMFSTIKEGGYYSEAFLFYEDVSKVDGFMEKYARDADFLNASVMDKVREIANRELLKQKFMLFSSKDCKDVISFLEKKGEAPISYDRFVSLAIVEVKGELVNRYVQDFYKK